MKKFLVPLIIIAAIFLMPGCSTKFNIAAPYQNITVIYAFLDRADTAHYIRIEKAFLDQNKSALTMAQQFDSSFYANIDVRIERISFGSSTGVVFDTIHLNRVDLDVEGYPKQTGVFFNSPNYAYKFKANLDPEYLYRVVVTNLTTGQIDSASSPVIDDVTPGTMLVDVIDDSSTNRAGIDLTLDQENQNFQTNISYLPPPDFNFENLTSPVYLADEIIRFNWVDSNISTGARTAHSSDYDLGDQLMPTNAVSYTTTNPALYSALASALGTAPAQTVRLLDRCQVFVYLTTFDYNSYLQSSNLQGVGLTGNSIEPIYTNVKGKNALGLYTTRGLTSGYINLTPASIPALMANTLFQNANIRGTIYH